jgi:hypothetical protein
VGSLFVITCFKPRAIAPAHGGGVNDPPQLGGTPETRSGRLSLALGAPGANAARRSSYVTRLPLVRGITQTVVTIQRPDASPEKKQMLRAPIPRPSCEPSFALADLTLRPRPLPVEREVAPVRERSDMSPEIQPGEGVHEPGRAGFRGQCGATAAC